MSDDSSDKPATAAQAAQILSRVERLAAEVKEARAQWNEGVPLGCGALIAIAFVVWLLSGKSVSDLESEVSDLRSEVRQLKTSMEAQTAELQRLRDRLVPPARVGDAQEK